jgi:RND family efflux transporter MFP subunit
MNGRKVHFTMGAGENDRHHDSSRQYPGKRRSLGKGLFCLLLLGGAVFLGKTYLEGRSEGQAPASLQVQPPDPVVTLYTVRIADFAVAKEYLGRVEPIQSVAIRPEVSGQIEEVHFKEGSAVAEGDLLFTINSREYRATVALRKAELAKAQANLDRALKYNSRLKSADTRSVSATDLELSESEVLQGKSSVEQAKAALQLAQIDLDRCRIVAPISGRVGRALFTKGNYVTPASGPLTTIVQTDPIRVVLSLPDKDYLKEREAFAASENAVYEATLRLADGAVYPGKGSRDFESNVMDEKTGTLQVVLRFDNAGGALVPGAMVRVTLKPAQKRLAPVIPVEAVLADGEGDYVYVVDGENRAERRSIGGGELSGQLLSVVSGLEAGEKIVLKGLQALRPGMTVQPVADGGDEAGETPAERARASEYDLDLMPLSGDEGWAPTGKVE